MSLGVTPVDRVRLWEAQFRAMEREWGEISVHRMRVLVAAWRAAMSETRRQHDRLVSDGLWATGPSDFLAIIDLARAENTHSRMLRWLLKPTGRHGLGSGLVRRLMEHCTGEPTPASLAVREVAFSQWRNDREADLVVRGEDFTLVIENKVDATEQPCQCDDLYANFKNEKAPTFLFLTPDGRKPRTATSPDALRAFRTLSWPEVRTMIETALNESRPVSARAVAVSCQELPADAPGAVQMNRIEDEPIKFYLEHEAQIREWAALETEVAKFADRFYRSLKGRYRRGTEDRKDRR